MAVGASGESSRPVHGVRARDLAALGITAGVVGGLLEGLVHMGLHRLAVLDNSWYPIIWIAAVVNGLLVTGGAVAVALVTSWLPRRSFLTTLSVFVVIGAGVAPVTALALKEWVASYAILSLTLGLTLVLTRAYVGRLPAAAAWCRRAGAAAVALTVLAAVGMEGGAWILERVRTARLPAAPAGSPDVLVLVLDTVRADHLSSYGYQRSTSPTFDRLAREGVLFEHAFATSSYTLPSHASLLTGLYPHDHGVEWQTSHRLKPTYPTLPAVLRERGYRTGAFSANTFFFSREHGFGRGFLHFAEYFHSIPDRFFRTAYGQIATKVFRGRFGWRDLPGRKLAEDVNRELLRWMGNDPSHPVFVVANYLDAHDPYLPPEPYRTKFSNGSAPRGIINSKLGIPRTLAPEQLQSEIDAYDGGIAYMDAQFAQLLDAWQARRRGRPLLVIVTSDHGEEFAEHGNFTHGSSLYRELIEVPLIVWSPDLVPAARVATPVSNVAVPATVMGFVDAADRTFAGPPLARLWRAAGEDAVAWAPPVAELTRQPWAPRRDPVSRGSLRSAVGSRLHYIVSDEPSQELFDWTDDPRETRNRFEELASLPEVERLRQALSRKPLPASDAVRPTP